MKKVNFNFKVEYNKKVVRKIKQWRKWLTLTSAILFFSFLSAIISFFTYSPIAVLLSIGIFVIDLFVHLSIVGKIYRLEQEGGLDMFTGTGFPD